MRQGGGGVQGVNECQLFVVYGRVGRFCTYFRILCKGMLFAVPLGPIWGPTKFFDFSSKTSEKYPFKGPDFQKNPRANKYKFFLLRNVFFNIFNILKTF